jgi:hypothetical protein
VLTQTVNKQGTETADFQFTSGASSLSVGIGQSGSLTLTVKPLNDFTGNVSLACGTQPAGITCQTSPNSVSITNSQSKTSTLTINVASSFVASNDARPRRDFPAAPWALGTLVLGFMGISGVRARKSAAFRAVVLIVVISGVLALAGCGAVQQQTPTSVTKTIQVTATGTSGNGSPIVHSINFNVTIQ